MTTGIDGAKDRASANKNRDDRSTSLLLLSYILQSIIAGAAVPFLALVVGVITSGITPNWLARVVGEPYFLLPIGMAFATAIYQARRSVRWIRPNTFVWIPAVLWLAFLIYFDDYRLRYPGEIFWMHVWDNYFGRGCSATECIGEWLGTAPVYCSIAYSLTTLLFRKARKTVSGESSMSSVPS